MIKSRLVALKKYVVDLIETKSTPTSEQLCTLNITL